MLGGVIADSAGTRSPSPMILLDAAGTLIAVRGTVGDIYSRIAADFNLDVSAHLINEAFARLLPTQPPMIVPLDLSPPDRQRAEFLWWKTLADEVFRTAGATISFDQIFGAVFDYFRSPSAWIVFPDVVPTLEQLRLAGVRLAVVSNFDSRLLEILAALKLDQYFEAIHFSTDLGFAKPDPRIFEAVLSKHQISPNAAWHVGDSLRDDVAGALKAGIRPIWLDRLAAGINNNQLTRIQSLDQLHELLLKE